MSESPRQPPAEAAGRLSQPPHRALLELLYEPQLAADLHVTLPYLLRIDAAHVVMLAAQDIVSRETAAALIRVNRDLHGRLVAGQAPFEVPPQHRGLYLLYERQFLDRLGPQQGGAAHVARSRNDVNAAVQRLRLRDELFTLLRHGEALAAALLALASAQVTTPMSGFTHLQPAQPTTLGHYLTAVASELLRSLETLGPLLEQVNRSPLGAAAGFGTSFLIDRARVARLLGFAGVVDSSLDAVASRDHVLRVLGELALLGTSLTRWGLDFQHWGSRAYGFLNWPDELVSTSSIMPQKRNAYVWETIRGLATQPAAALMQALMGVKNTPFSNGVEAGSEAFSGLWPALAGLTRALRLAEVLVAATRVDAERMARFLDGAETTMTALADHLVAEGGLAFRTAHELVAQLAVRAPGTALTPARARELLRELGPAFKVVLEEAVLEEAVLARVLDPAASLQAACYGGGPAPPAVRYQIVELTERLNQRRTWRTVRLDQLMQAEQRLIQAMAELSLARQGEAR